MRKKLISIILCFSIVVSSSVASASQASNPDPEFLGNFMIYNFIQTRFNLKESKKYQKALSDVPENLRGLTEVWTIIYLSWVFYYLASRAYDKQFADKMLETANKKWATLGEEMAVFEYWFPKLDSVLKSDRDVKIKGQKLPLAVFIAMTFLALDSGSPFYKQANPDTKMVDFSIAIALAEAKDSAMVFMENVIKIGGPVDDTREADSQYFSDQDERKFTSQQGSQKDSTAILDDIQVYTRFYKVIALVYSGYMEIFGMTAQIEDLGKSYLQEKITLEYAEEKKRLIHAEINFALQSANQRNKELALPELKTERFRLLAQSFYNYVKALPQSIENGTEISLNLFNASISGDQILIQKYDIMTRQNLITMIEGENLIAKSTIAQTKEGNPNAWLYKTFVCSNEAMIAIIKARISEMEMSSDDVGINFQSEDSHTYIKLAKISVKTAYNLIATGRTKIESHREDFRNATSSGDLGKYGSLFDEILDTFYESFDVEENILKAFQMMLEVFPSDEGIDEVSVVVDSFINKRSALDQKRMELVSTFK